MFRFDCRLGLRILVALVVLSSFNSGLAQEDGEFRSGIDVTYRSEDGTKIQSVVPTIERAGKQSARSVQWEGLLFAQGTGEYQFAAFVSGEVKVTVGDRVLLQASSEKPQWISSKPTKLNFDRHPLSVTHQGNTGTLLRLYWRGPTYQWEPIGARWLFRADGAEFDESLIRGARLAKKHRCSACHSVPAESNPGPSLAGVRGNLRTNWLVKRLTDDGRQSTNAQRNMPYFGLSSDNAKAIAAYLFSNSKPPKSTPNETQGDVDRGRQMVFTVGCLACHTAAGIGSNDQVNVHGGGPLENIAAKRTPEFFGRWLTNPASVIANHRMPVFDLSKKEKADVITFLKTLNVEQDVLADERINESAATIAKGKMLFAKHRCGSCHDAKLHEARLEKTLELDTSRKGCLGEANAEHPGYHFAADQQRALVEFLAENIAPSKLEGPEAKLADNNCLACHQRGTGRGLSDVALQVTKEFPKLAVASLKPPSLDSIGDKLNDKALHAAVKRAESTRRAWLNIRMPKFRFDDQQRSELVDLLIAADRVPEGEHTLRPEQIAGVDALGARLVTTDGFGCTSCHAVGATLPVKAPLNALGPDLAEMGQRIRYPWYRRWVHNPARIVPQMEMPSVRLPVKGLLKDDLEEQLSAVWNVLNRPGFVPPEPDPLRVLRHSGIELKSRAIVQTDVTQAEGKTWIKPLMVGLANRHNLFYDLESGQLTRWSVGDLARQRTKGKAWFWEAAGENLLQRDSTRPELAVFDKEGNEVSVQPVGQFVTEMDELEHVDYGIRLTHRLRFLTGENTHFITVKQTYTPITGDVWSGVRRTIDMRGLSRFALSKFSVVPTREANFKVVDSGRGIAIPAEFPTMIRVVGGDHEIARDGVVSIEHSTKPFQIVLDYVSATPIDRFHLEAPPSPQPDVATLSVVPGFEATRAPIADEWMPTGLAWRKNGDLIVTSLKGRVWVARDTDGDGIEDSSSVYSDELAAPFGAVAGENYIDVINKYALLRLFDNDGDGHAEKTVRLASGWGHTADYHDWAIGLPTDAEGNYYASFACQQDDRSAAGAKLRGTVVQLMPRPGMSGVDSFAVRQLTAGHRFPIGIARNKLGQLFVTDNQGNYNPFNELNHVVAGKRYGFINKIDRKPGFSPPFQAPNIDIPHPWTRSVNGICFLDTPAEISKTTPAVFGPFEGHLVGCEYDTRRLVRMSLQKVGDVIQGAAYPMSVDEPSGEPFLGPITCAVSPAGALYIGCIRDSGWGGANNIGTLVKLVPQWSKLPAGIAEVRHVKGGFEIQLTKSVDAKKAVDPTNYTISSYTRVSTPAYGGKDEQSRQETIKQFDYDSSKNLIRLQLDNLRPNFVYEFHLKSLVTAGLEFFPAEAFYTLRNVEPQ